MEFSSWPHALPRFPKILDISLEKNKIMTKGGKTCDQIKEGCHTTNVLQNVLISTQIICPSLLLLISHYTVQKYDSINMQNWNFWDFSVISSVAPTTIGSLFHFGRFGFALLSVYQYRFWLVILSSMPETLFIMILLDITRRLVKSLLWLCSCTTGWCTGWVTSWVRWATELRSTRYLNCQKVLVNSVWVYP